MKSDILNALGGGAAPGFDNAESDPVESQLAADEGRGAGDGTIYVLTHVNEVAGTVVVGISTAANTAGTVRLTGEGSATFPRSVGSNVFLLMNAQDSGFVRGVRVEKVGFPMSAIAEDAEKRRACEPSPSLVA